MFGGGRLPAPKPSKERKEMAQVKKVTPGKPGPSTPKTAPAGDLKAPHLPIPGK